MNCAECGREIIVDDAGVSHHVGGDNPDGIDYDADADHTPYSDQESLLVPGAG